MTKIGLVIGVVLALLAAVPAEADAQYCVGFTKYTVRGPDGNVLTKKQLPKLRFERFDGKRRKVVFKRGVARVGYDVGREVRRHRISADGGVHIIFGPCGQISELVLQYRGKTMELLFNVEINNTNFVIDSVPFQEGRFRLSSLACADGKAAPMVDNENHGHCTVPASAWQKVTPRETSKAPSR